MVYRSRDCASFIADPVLAVVWRALLVPADADLQACRAFRERERPEQRIVQVIVPPGCVPVPSWVVCHSYSSNDDKVTELLRVTDTVWPEDNVGVQNRNRRCRWRLQRSARSGRGSPPARVPTCVPCSSRGSTADIRIREPASAAQLSVDVRNQLVPRDRQRGDGRVASASEHCAVADPHERVHVHDDGVLATDRQRRRVIRLGLVARVEQQLVRT